MNLLRDTTIAGHGASKIAFVLSGGASYGAAQAGMLLALADAGVAPDVVIGASVGALNAAFFASGGDVETAERLVHLWKRIRRRDVFPIRPVQAAAALIGRRDGLVDATSLRRLIEREIPFRRIEDAPVPFRAIATDAATGRSMTLSTGSVVDALLASAAMPGVFPPVNIDGRALIDGAITSNFAVSAAVQSGADVVYALPAAENTAPPTGALGMLVRASDLMIARATDAQLASVGSTKVHVLPTPTVDVSMFDFGRSDELAAAGYELTRRWLDDQRKAHPAPAAPHGEIGRAA